MFNALELCNSSSDVALPPLLGDESIIFLWFMVSRRAVGGIFGSDLFLGGRLPV
jgi:hypothetical protein